MITWAGLAHLLKWAIKTQPGLSPCGLWVRAGPAHLISISRRDVQVNKIVKPATLRSLADIAARFIQALAQICLTIEYAAMELTALHSLADIAACFIQVLARSGVIITTAHGQINANFLDLIRTMEDLSLLWGFTSAFDPTIPLLRSSILRELMAFI